MTVLADAARVGATRSLRDEQPSAAAALATFTALAGFCAFNYAALVRPVPVGTVAVLLTTAIAVACALGWSGRRGRAWLPLRLAIIVAGAAVGLVALGIPVRFLLPWNFGELRDGISQGLAGLDSFQWPYTGGDRWIRTTILAALPLALVAATALAFWPRRSNRRLHWVPALALLLLLYGTGVSELSAGSWALRGAVLVMLVAAWIWGPTIGMRQLPRATGLVVTGVALALALTTLVSGSPALLSYRTWDLFSAAGTQFQWDQTYGPISWPRNGTLLLEARSAQPHYWKVETLDRFDGERWMHTDERSLAPAAHDVPQDPNRRWLEEASVDVRGLRSNLLVGAGTLLSVATTKLTDAEPDGTTRVVDSPLSGGDAYTFRAYVPDPAPAELAAAPARFPVEYLAYTDFELPAAAGSSVMVGSSEPGRAPGDDPALMRRILASPYGRTYELAHSLADGQRTTYGVVTAVEDYLGRGFSYSESPPVRRYPLPAFLFRDRVGYCQQFSGAMALLLRMDGIPARVAAGFAPGAYDAASHSYRVRDLDAHAWVEVYFSGIGWVTFDPTPPLAPAEAHSASVAPVKALASGGATSFGAADKLRAGGDRAVRALERRKAVRKPPGGGVALAPVTAGAALLAAGVLAWSILRRRRRRRRPGGADAAVAELRAALERLGHPCPPETTLAQLERRLSVTAGPAAARYARALRDHRYAPGQRRVPGPSERNALRRALTADRGVRARLTGLLALPPTGGERAGRG